MTLGADEVRDFYERSYDGGDEQADRGSRWRQLSARGKADHIVHLCARCAVTPQTLLEVGCGDGAVLAELASRGFAGRCDGIEISESAVAAAQERPGITVRHYDGQRIDAADLSYDLVYATHVLEHIHDPAPVIAELARVGRAVIVEVPLENNLSARRPAAVAASQAAGHVQAFSRAEVRRLVADAGLQIRAELLDPLPLEVQLFGRDRSLQRASGYASWLIRRTLAAAPPVATRAFTMHYALLAARSTQ